MPACTGDKGSGQGDASALHSCFRPNHSAPHLRRSKHTPEPIAHAFCLGIVDKIEALEHEAQTVSFKIRKRKRFHGAQSKLQCELACSDCLASQPPATFSVSLRRVLDTVQRCLWIERAQSELKSVYELWWESYGGRAGRLEPGYIAMSTLDS